MRKLLLFVFSLALAATAQAQTFAPESGASDTVWTPYNGSSTVQLNNYLSATTSTPVTLKWKVIAMGFGPGWDASQSGICDNRFCRYDINALYANTAYERSEPYAQIRGDFHVLFAANNPPTGSVAYVTIQLTDTAVSSSSRTLTFMVNKPSLGVGQSMSANDNITVFPNPARDYVNVLFSRQANVRKIAVFNLIGKTMRVFIPTDDNSAKLDLDNIPSGVYFIRLMNESGQVVATRRFTHQ